MTVHATDSTLHYFTAKTTEAGVGSLEVIPYFVILDEFS